MGKTNFERDGFRVYAFFMLLNTIFLASEYYIYINFYLVKLKLDPNESGCKPLL